MSCLNLVFAVAILDMFSFVLTVQVIIALQYGVYHTNILISFIVLGENMFVLYGIYQIKCVFLKHLYGDVNIDMQLLIRFASFYYCAMHSRNQIVSLCAKMCEHSKSIVASNRKYLLYQLNYNGSIFERSLSKLKNKSNTVHFVEQ